MERFLWVGLAGALGTWVRYLVSLGAQRVLGPGVPWGTLVVNVVGCLVMGFVASIAATALAPTARVTLTVGFLGGLTTYSSFNQEATTLLREGDARTGGVYLAATLVSCALAGLAGAALARRFA
jgi:CrcB protein